MKIREGALADIGRKLIHVAGVTGAHLGLLFKDLREHPGEHVVARGRLHVLEHKLRHFLSRKR